MTSVAVAKWYIEKCLCWAGGVWYWLNEAVKIQHFPNNFIFRRFLLLFFSNKGFRFLLGVHFWNMTPHSETTTNIDHTARQPPINSSPQSREAVLSRAGAPHTKYLFALQRSNFSGQWVSLLTVRWLFHENYAFTKLEWPILTFCEEIELIYRLEDRISKRRQDSVKNSACIRCEWILQMISTSFISASWARDILAGSPLVYHGLGRTGLLSGSQNNNFRCWYVFKIVFFCVKV